MFALFYGGTIFSYLVRFYVLFSSPDPLAAAILGFFVSWCTFYICFASPDPHVTVLCLCLLWN